MNKGDLVLIPFPFTDLSSAKLRPAVVLIATPEDLTVSFITTQLKWKESTDIEVQPCDLNRLKKRSLIRLSKIATIDLSLAEGILGELNQTEIEELNSKLKVLLQLN